MKKQRERVVRLAEEHAVLVSLDPMSGMLVPSGKHLLSASLLCRCCAKYPLCDYCEKYGRD